MKVTASQHRNTWTYPLILFGLMLLAHCIQLFQPGFFWDDWQVIFLGQLRQPGAYWDYFLADRPLSAWTYILTMPILGNSALAWQLFTLTVRWAAILGFVRTLRLVFPQQPNFAQVVGFLMAIYPGFTQQAISVAYSQHFIALALFSGSLVLMVESVRQPHKAKWAVPLSALMAATHMLTIEYFAGLEALRPILLWYLLRQPSESVQKTGLRVLRNWWPYLLAAVAFFGYRFYAYPALYPQFESNPPILLQNLATQPLPWILHLIELISQDGLFALIFAWLAPLTPAEFDLNARLTYFSWGLGLLAGAGVFFFMRRSTADEAPSKRDQIRLLALGGLAFLCGGLPVWSTNRQAIQGAFSDRFTLGMIFGAVLLLIVALRWVITSRPRTLLVLALLVSAGVARQLQELNRYRLHWEMQRSYTWQLLWRAPGLQAGTAVIGPVLPYGLSGDYAVAFYHNLIYSRQYDLEDLPYWWYNGKRTWNSEQILGKKPSSTLESEFRSAHFSSTVGESMPVAFNSSMGCLLVLDPIYASGTPFNFETDFYAWANPARALRQPNYNADFIRQIFGEEPQDNWCKYFQQADLARQYADWDSAIQLWQAAEKQKLAPTQAREFVPFIEAFARTGDIERAAQLTSQALELDEQAAEMLCAIWQRVPGASVSAAPLTCTP